MLTDAAELPPLDEDEKVAIETYGLSDLNDFLPSKPTDEQLNDVFNLFLSSVEGLEYDGDKYGHLPWKPYGLKDKEVAERKVPETAESILAKIQTNKKVA